MKIACLQFAPHLGDVNNNLNRADAVLNKATDVDGLDLLVLPELAFSGYNFRSLAHITPFLEPSASGISSLWARTAALKYNCHTIVGYPEKVDVSDKWPANPEFYNSAVIISRDGETVGNYRKSFLYAVDETWALEGQDGFFDAEMPGLGNMALGICMDLKFEAPWDDFEFAYHVLHVEANLVVISMAWLTREDAASFSQLPHEPDMFTLEYWIQRLEPVIRKRANESRRASGEAPTGLDEEIIVVFCNRTGVEDNAVYAGTSAVIGISNGEVNLYGVLGRGVKELLVVDTSKQPIAKLVRSESRTSSVYGEQQQQEKEHQLNDNGEAQRHQSSHPDTPLPQSPLDRSGGVAGKDNGKNDARARHADSHGPSSPTSMFNFPPSSPNPAAVRNGRSSNDELHHSDRSPNTKRNSFEFASPLSTEASWKRWETSAAERLTNTNNDDATSTTGSMYDHRSRAWLAEARPPVPNLQMKAFDKTSDNHISSNGSHSNRNSVGAFRDAVGSPPPEWVEFTAIVKGPVDSSAATSLPKGSDRQGTPKQQKAEKRDQKPKMSTPRKEVFSPQLVTRQSSSHSNEQDRHSQRDWDRDQNQSPRYRRRDDSQSRRSPPIIFGTPTINNRNDNENHGNNDQSLDLRLGRSRSARSWDSTTGNNSASSDDGRGGDQERLIHSAHPGYGHGYQVFPKRLVSPSRGHGPERTQYQRQESTMSRDALQSDHKDPESYYKTHSSNSNIYGKGKSYQQGEKDRPIFFGGDDIAADFDNKFNDIKSDNDNEQQYSNDVAVMSELMRLFKPRQEKQQQQQQQQHEQQGQQRDPRKEKHYNHPPPSAPPGVGRNSAPLRPTSTKSRNTSRPRLNTMDSNNNSSSSSNVNTKSNTPLLFRPATGSRLTRSTSQPQLHVPLTSTPHNHPHNHQPKEQQQQPVKAPSRNNSAQRGPDVALYFRPDIGSRNNSSTPQSSHAAGRPASAEKSHARRSSATRASGGRSASMTNTPAGGEHESGTPTSAVRASTSTRSRPLSRGRQPVSVKSPVQTASPAGISSVWPTGRSRNRPTGGAGPTNSTTATKNKSNKNKSNNKSNSSSERGRPLTGTSSTESPFLQLERAASAMSFRSGTSFSSSVMATESWLASTPAPPVLHQQQNPVAHSASAAALPPASRPVDPDDEIIAMINLVHRRCPVHRTGHHNHDHSHANSGSSSSLPPSRNQPSQPPATSSPWPDPQQPPASSAQPSSAAKQKTATAKKAVPPDSGLASPPAGDLGDDDDGESLYEVILPPHIRSLVESMANPMDRSRSAGGGQSSSQGSSRNRSVSRFNPPTPRAMQFSPEVADAESATAAA